MPTKLSQRLDGAIRESKFSDYKIAQKLRISQSTINNYRKGITLKPDERKLKAICEFIGASFNYILTGEGELMEPSSVNSGTSDLPDLKKFQTEIKVFMENSTHMMEAIWKETQKNRQERENTNKTLNELNRLMTMLIKKLDK